MSLKQVTVNGWLKDVNDNFEALAPIGTDIGIGSLCVARFVFDVDGVDSSGEPNVEVGAHGMGVTIPQYGIVVGGFVDVNTPFTGEASAALAIRVEDADDIVTSAAVSGAPWSTIGCKAIVPKANTPESTSVKTTVAREITVTVGTAELLTGKLTGYLYLVEGILSSE